MAKCYSIIAIIGIAVLVAAELPRLGQLKSLGNLRIQNNRIFSFRQEQIPDAAPSPTPYQPAGITPVIPFDLPTENEAPLDEPDQTYGPPQQTPDQTYLPPEPNPNQTYGPPEPIPDQTYGPPEVKGTPTITEPDNTYIPATTHDEPVFQDPDAEEFSPSQNFFSENIIQSRKNLKVRSRPAPLNPRTPAQRLRSAALRLRNTLMKPRLNTVDIMSLDPVLFSTLH